VKAAADGRFHVYAVESVDEAVRLLSGREPGEPTPGGDFPDGTFNARVQQRLARLATASKEWGAGNPTAAAPPRTGR
jgi:hypothetical protein